MEQLMNNMPFEIADNFNMNTIVAIEELINYDMIYIYHHLQIGSKVELKKATENIKGDMRFAVYFKTFKLGYITISSFLAPIYTDISVIACEINSFVKEKFLPIKAIDLKLQATKIKLVS
ncbi:hypothetical protein [Crocinitomix catalasitica]|uniref:hypothetical protein n=1 Tax=Crocinitomix catalasitica TaxID=184607 RepID=UPI0004814080|nr:hypothetical protein [Crocinitomix catalasitica]